MGSRAARANLRSRRVRAVRSARVRHRPFGRAHKRELRPSDLQGTIASALPSSGAVEAQTCRRLQQPLTRRGPARGRHACGCHRHVSATSTNRRRTAVVRRPGATPVFVIGGTQKGRSAGRRRLQIGQAGARCRARGHRNAATWLETRRASRRLFRQGNSSKIGRTPTIRVADSGGRSGFHRPFHVRAFIACS